MQTRQARPLIYRCMGLCHEYAKPRHAAADLGDWLSMRSSPSRRRSLPAGQSGLLGRFCFCFVFLFQLAQTQEMLAMMMYSLHLIIPPPPPTPQKKSLAPPHCPCQSPSPSFSCLSICSLVPGLEQRAIWARLPASSGRPLHRKDSFNSTSVCHDQRHECLPPPPFAASLLVAPKRSIH